MRETSKHDRDRWETRFVDCFVLEAKRDRYRAILRNDKKRAKLLNRLNHNPDFDFSKAVALEGPATQGRGLLEVLAAEGIAGNCWLMSDLAALDGRFCRTEEGALLTASADLGTVMICSEGTAGLYRPEAPAKQLHLFRQDR